MRTIHQNKTEATSTMPDHDCTKSDKIDNIAHTLERMEESQKDIVTLLQKVASQDTRLDHLEEHAENAYKDMNELFNRVRDVELNQAANGPAVRERLDGTITGIVQKLDLINNRLDKLLTFHKIATSKIALYLYAAIVIMIASGTFLDFMYHKDTLTAIIKFFK